MMVLVSRKRGMAQGCKGMVPKAIVPEQAQREDRVGSWGKRG